MNEIPPTPPKESDPGGAKGPRKLLRSSRDKMLGGVAGGLAEYFSVDPILIRIGFAITGLLGIGILAYLALFIFVPEDDGWGNPFHARDRDRLLAGGAIVLILAAIPGGVFPLASLNWWWELSALLFWLAVVAGIGYAIYWMLSGRKKESDGTAPPTGSTAAHSAAMASDQAGADQPTGITEEQPTFVAGAPASAPAAAATRPGNGRSLGNLLLMAFLFACLAVGCVFLAFTSAWGAAVGGGAAVAIAVILCGLLIALAAFKRPLRWLIAPAIALALPAAAVAASGYELEGGYGERIIRPALLTDIPEDGYEMAAGNLTIDLRQADWRRNSTVDLPTRINFGQITVVVPKNVCVASDIEAWAGGFEVLGESDSDYRVRYRRTLPPKATPRLNLTSQVDIGWVEVLTELPTDPWDEHGHGKLREPNAKQPKHCLEGRR